jgi:hypothetical protein
MSASAPAKPDTRGNPLVLLRPASYNDIQVAWTFYEEAVKPYLAPRLVVRFGRDWEHDRERANFGTWWTTTNTSMILLSQRPVGWLHHEESNSEITLVNYCVGLDFRRRGVGSTALGLFLNDLCSKNKPVIHSLLKGSPCRSFFEKRGFDLVGEDDLVFVFKRPARP